MHSRVCGKKQVSPNLSDNSEKMNARSDSMLASHATSLPMDCYRLKTFFYWRTNESGAGVKLTSLTRKRSLLFRDLIDTFLNGFGMKEQNSLEKFQTRFTRRKIWKRCPDRTFCVMTLDPRIFMALDLWNIFGRANADCFSKARAGYQVKRADFFMSHFGESFSFFLFSLSASSAVSALFIPRGQFAIFYGQKKAIFSAGGISRVCRINLADKSWCSFSSV